MVYRMKLLIFLCESAQNAFSHKIPHKFSGDGAQPPTQTPSPLGRWTSSPKTTPSAPTAPHSLNSGLDAFGVLVSEPRWLNPPTVKILATFLIPQTPKILGLNPKKWRCWCNSIQFVKMVDKMQPKIGKTNQIKHYILE